MSDIGDERMVATDNLEEKSRSACDMIGIDPAEFAGVMNIVSGFPIAAQILVGLTVATVAAKIDNRSRESFISMCESAWDSNLDS